MLHAYILSYCRLEVHFQCGIAATPIRIHLLALEQSKTKISNINEQVKRLN